MNRRQFIDRSLLAFAGSALFSCLGNKKTLFEKNQVLGCFGDSITASEGGYVKILQQLMNQSRPDLALKFLNYGKSSETVTGLTEKEHPGPRPYLFDRLEDELDKTPIDVAFFCYGINCGIYGQPSKKLFDTYSKGVHLFLDKMKARDIGVVLLTPPPLALDAVATVPTNAIDDYGYLNPYPEYDKEVLQVFKRIILEIEETSVLAKIDIRGPLYENRNECYDNDPIHPNEKGHQLIASTIIEKISF